MIKLKDLLKEFDYDAMDKKVDDFNKKTGLKANPYIKSWMSIGGGRTSQKFTKISPQQFKTIQKLSGDAAFIVVDTDKMKKL